MDRLTPLIVEALTGLLPLRAVVARNDSGARRQEGLAETVELLFGNDARRRWWRAACGSPLIRSSGQKTGWFFDQRPNRDRVAALAQGARVLDVFCHVGAFGLRCAAAGAREVLLLDSSAPALAQAEHAAALNGVARRVAVRRGDAFDVMAELAAREQFDIVVCDPPAFARSTQGRGGWVARLRPDGTPGGTAGGARWLPVRRLVQPSCAAGGLERDRSRRLHRASREGRIVFTGGAGRIIRCIRTAGNRIPEGAIDPCAVSQTRAHIDRDADLARLPQRRKISIRAPTIRCSDQTYFKLGVFSANCDGGLTMSLAPERWRADWDDIVAMTRIADEAGMEFILPVAKWRGFQGKANIYGHSFETLTHGAALGALTRRIAIFSTVHVPLVTPAFGAKAIATIDHVTHGRAGLNIVCGWNQEEFDLHGVTIDQDRRYEHGLEWFKVWSRLLEGGRSSTGTASSFT